MLHSTKIDLDKEKREQVIGILNSRLADAVDLQSQAKQAHWNVKGMHFIALHELFDQVSTEILTHIDDIAERVTTLGGTAMGTVRVAAQNSSLSQYPLKSPTARRMSTRFHRRSRISVRRSAPISTTRTSWTTRTRPIYLRVFRGV